MKPKAILIIIGIFMFSDCCFGQARLLKQDIRYSFWNASWIAAQGASPTGYGVYVFRKTIDLAHKPDKFVIHISADNRYKLFINEQFVSAGPSRGDIHHYNYETIDLAPYLKAGKNIIAAQVWNEAEFRPQTERTGRACLVLRLV